MSRSRKLAIVKDKTGRWYNKIIRRVNKHEVRELAKLVDPDDHVISHPNEIINPWDISDYTVDWEHNNSVAKWFRKLHDRVGAEHPERDILRRK